MSFTEKMDVLDLLINILRKHEEKLDELVERLERTQNGKVKAAVEMLEEEIRENPYLQGHLDDALTTLQEGYYDLD